MIRPRLILFPGLGLDARLFEPQRELPARIEIPTPLVPLLNESLEHYAMRTARAIDPTGPLFLGGVSLGAMIALEAARHVPTRGVFVIAGGRSHRELSPFARAVAHLASNVPARMLRQSLELAPMAIRMVGRPDRREREFLLQLLHSVNVPLARWAVRAILAWEFRDRPGDAPIHWIHGRLDRIVPVRCVQPSQIVEGAGHAVSITHAAQVNHFIANRLAADKEALDNHQLL